MKKPRNRFILELLMLVFYLAWTAALVIGFIMFAASGNSQ